MVLLMVKPTVNSVQVKSLNVLEIVKTIGEMLTVLNSHIFIVKTHSYAKVASVLGLVKMSMKKLNV
jgi:hypothetical protein